MKKKTESFFQAFGRRFNSFVPVFLLVLLISNCFAIWYFEKSRLPQVIYSVERVSSSPASSSVVSVTNSSPVVSAPSPVVPDHVPLSSTNKLFTVQAFYDYGISWGRRFALLWGRYFYEGDPTSYGEISFIYPERIILADGSVIVNTKWNNARSVTAPAPVVPVSDQEGGVL